MFLQKEIKEKINKDYVLDVVHLYLFIMMTLYAICAMSIKKMLQKY